MANKGGSYKKKTQGQITYQITRTKHKAMTGKWKMHNKRKWEETGVNVCDRSVANGLNRKGFTHR